MSEHDAIAKKLVDDVRKRCDDLLTLADEWTDLEANIAAALAAERAKFAAFAAENGRLRKALDRIAYGPFGATEADQVTPTNISTATEVENSSEHIPTLYIGVSVHPCSQDRRWYLTTDAGLSPDDVREGARPRIFRLPSTADAERAKERERLIAEVVAASRSYEAESSVSRLGELTKFAKALAAFDAENGGKTE